MEQMLKANIFKMLLVLISSPVSTLAYFLSLLPPDLTSFIRLLHAQLASQ
jgi:hypothetical protein